MSPNNISISINQEDIYIMVDPEGQDWKHTCITWDSETGLLQVWINGKPYIKKVTRNRYPIGPQMIVILGQDQDNYGGGFEVGQAFVGEMCDVNMWDYVLPPAIIKAYFADDYTIGGNIYSWKGGKHTVKGSILVLGNQFYPKRQLEAKCYKPI